MTSQSETLLGEFRLGRQLTTPAQVAAIGVAVLLGLLVLIAGPALSFSKSGASTASLVALGLVGLTLLSVVELLGGSGEHGGTYMLVQEILGGAIGFLTGWSLLAAGLALVAALTQAAAAELVSLIGIGLPEPQLALTIFLGLVFLRVFQALPRQLRIQHLVPALLAGFLVVLVTLLPAFGARPPAVDQRLPAGSFPATIAWVCALYLAFEAILAARRQVRFPGRHLPLAILYTLATAAVVFPVTLLITAGLPRIPGAATPGLVTLLQTGSPLPDDWIGWLGVLALVVAASGGSLAAARLANAMSREGALPGVLRWVGRPFSLPPVLFLVLTLLAAPLILFAGQALLINVAAGLYLAVLIALNVAAIQSHRTEPDRRRPFSVPFAPLLPLLAIILNLVMLQFIPRQALLAAGGWLLVGGLVYITYARGRQVEAQVGEIVFRRRTPEEGSSDRFRILVPIGPGEERHMLLSLATSLAHQLRGEVIPLQVIPVPDPLSIEEGRRTAQERNTLFQWSTRRADDLGVTTSPITRLARSVSEGIMDTALEESCDLILIPWSLKENRQRVRSGSILGRVAREAPCDVAVVAYHPEIIRAARLEAESTPGPDGDTFQERPPESVHRFQPRRILVPTSGGPNAPLAIRLALLLAREHDATVSSVYIASPDATPEDLAGGEQRIQATIAAMREQAAELPGSDGPGHAFDQIPIEGRVLTAEGVVAGIAEACADFHLALLGASEEGVIDQVLFGNIPEQVAQASPSPVIIVKRYRGLPRLWLQRTWDTIATTLPTLGSEEQIQVYRTIHREARPDVDFFIMMGLSTLIATYGLFQDSSAVIIGAMLVAPLFSPLLALSLAIVQGNMRLLRVALEANLKGVALAIGLATALGWLVPLKSLTPEILARSQPDLTDLAVALASGAAGAYAIARKDVAAALPGVAIAAALVPPLGVTGIGLALGDLSIAGGGGLLFATNLVAIVLAGSVTFLLLGFRPGGHGAREIHLRRGLIVTVLFFLLITIPLIAFFVRSVQDTQTRQFIQQTITSHLEEAPGIELESPDDIQIEERGGTLIVTVPLNTHGLIPQDFLAGMQADLDQGIDQPVRLRALPIQVIEAPPG